MIKGNDMEELQKKQNLTRFLLTAFLVLSIASAAFALRTVCVASAWSWTFTQGAFLKGVAEMVGVFLALVCAVCIPKRTRTRVLCVAAVVLAFAFLHAMLFVLPAMLLYAGMILMTGHLLCRLLCKRYADEPLALIPLGMAAIIVLVALCSLVRLGTSDKLRIVFAVIFLFEVVFCRKKILCGARAVFDKTHENGYRFSAEGWVLAGVIAALLIQVGRACISLDYDSLWYGLRSGAMLAPFTGIYDNVVSTGVVYTYSKGIEVLTLVFDFPNTHSFVYGVNVMFGAMLLYTAYRIMRVFAEKRVALFVSLCLSVTPGIMNMVVTAKSDVSTLFCQLLLVYFVVRGLKERDGDAFLLGLAAAVVSLCLKSSAIVFTSIVILIAFSVFLFQRTRIRPSGLLVLILPVLANIALMARTFLITGMPLTQMGAGIFEKLGFSYKHPYAAASSDYVTSLSTVFSAEGLKERLPRLHRFFFLPNEAEMDHVIIAWGGMLFAICWIALVLLVFCRLRKTLARIREDKAYAFTLITTAVVSAASLGAVFLLRKPDGNYFMLMYALTFIQLGLEVKELPGNVFEEGSKKILPLVASGAVFCLLTSGAWSVGLTEIKVENKGFYNHREYYEQRYEHVGLTEVANRLEEEGGKCRTIVFTGEEMWVLSLPAIADHWQDLAFWSTKGLGNSPEGMVSYFESTGMEFLVIERAFLENHPYIAERLLPIAQSGKLSLDTDGEKYILVRFHPSSATLDEGLCAELFAYTNDTE